MLSLSRTGRVLRDKHRVLRAVIALLSVHKSPSDYSFIVSRAR